MAFSQIKWPRDDAGNHPEPKTVKSKFMAWYECQCCNAKWDDDDRDKAVRGGDWFARAANWVKETKWRDEALRNGASAGGTVGSL